MKIGETKWTDLYVYYETINLRMSPKVVTDAQMIFLIDLIEQIGFNCINSVSRLFYQRSNCMC